MSHFGEALFEGSGCVRWALSPFLVAFAVGMPIIARLIAPWTSASIVAIVALELPCLALLAGFWLPRRFGRWAFRALAGMVFAIYLAGLIHELLFAPLHPPGEPGSLSQALAGFIVIAIPCLYFTIFGRFRHQQEAIDDQGYLEPPPEDDAR